jgi:hypothetical protein
MTNYFKKITAYFREMDRRTKVNEAQRGFNIIEKNKKLWIMNGDIAVVEIWDGDKAASIVEKIYNYRDTAVKFIEGDDLEGETTKV